MTSTEAGASFSISAMRQARSRSLRGGRGAGGHVCDRSRFLTPVCVVGAASCGSSSKKDARLPVFDPPCENPPMSRIVPQYGGSLTGKG